LTARTNIDHRRAIGDQARSGAPVDTGDGGRVSRGHRVTGVASVVVLLGVAVFAVWSSQATAAAVGRAVTAARVSDDYAQATTAVGAEQSLVLEYRLQPSPQVLARFDQSATAVVAALGAIRAEGDTADRALVDRVLPAHQDYLAATDRLFAAVNRGDAPTVARVSNTEVLPSHLGIERELTGAAADKHQRTLGEWAHLQRMQALTRLLTPVVLVVGLSLTAMLALITRRHRRLLSAERARAVYASGHDTLTGLPNRALLADRVGQALRTNDRAGTRTALLLIDLDRFKDINNAFGHHYGDGLLTQIGPRLAGVLRGEDTIARLGGDEFAVLLPTVTSVADATAVATKLQGALHAPFRVHDIDLDVEASIGIVVAGAHGQDPTTLLQHADIAMYVAKDHNLGVCAYDPAIDGYSPAKLVLLGDLRRALDSDQLVVHYQPKINISSGDVVGAEALIRWQHPQHGLLSPDAFIPLAEHTGLIGPLTRHVLDTALAQAAIWARAGWALPIAVNLSARNLADHHLPAQVAELLAAHQVPAELLQLEVTETAVIADPTRAQHVLQQLSDLGIGISLDDFGAGYTSLGQLKTLPISELKIDRSFVTTMTEDRSNTLIVRSVIDLGHDLGLTIVAEGVENQHTLTALAAYGCDIAQGYHHARPLNAANFTTWYTNHRTPQPTTTTPHTKP